MIDLLIENKCILVIHAGVLNSTDDLDAKRVYIVASIAAHKMTGKILIIKTIISLNKPHDVAFPIFCNFLVALQNKH